MHQPSDQVTRLLRGWREGEAAALEELTPLVYDALRHIARRHMRAERPGHTLQATALVGEAYLRLVAVDLDWRDRGHFYAVAARMMRRILVDHARGRQRDKRGGDVTHIALEEGLVPAGSSSTDLVELDDALSRLQGFDPRKGQIVELVYFGGLTYDETAAALDISAATVDRELRLAKAWLYRELSAAGDGPG